MVETLDSWIAAVGPLAFVALGLAALLEYVFPPFPGDTILLLGGVYAVRGDKPWWLVLLVITVGSVAGAAINYWVGMKVAGRFEHRNRPFLGLTHEKFHALQARMRKRGTLLLLANRFMPGVRGIIFLAAGAAMIPFGRVVGLGAVSALAWNAMVIGLGIAVGGNAETLATLLGRYQTAAFALFGIAAVGALVRFWLRRRKPPID
jgi:membrane protein DedA with SNARE-associated domain